MIRLSNLCAVRFCAEDRPSGSVFCVECREAAEGILAEERRLHSPACPVPGCMEALPPNARRCRTHMNEGVLCLILGCGEAKIGARALCRDHGRAYTEAVVRGESPVPSDHSITDEEITDALLLWVSGQTSSTTPSAPTPSPSVPYHSPHIPDLTTHGAPADTDPAAMMEALTGQPVGVPSERPQQRVRLTRDGPWTVVTELRTPAEAEQERQRANRVPGEWQRSMMGSWIEIPRTPRIPLALNPDGTVRPARGGEVVVGSMPQSSFTVPMRRLSAESLYIPMMRSEAEAAVPATVIGTAEESAEAGQDVGMQLPGSGLPPCEGHGEFDHYGLVGGLEHEDRGAQPTVFSLCVAGDCENPRRVGGALCQEHARTLRG